MSGCQRRSKPKFPRRTRIPVNKVGLMATPGNFEQGAGRHSPGFCGNRREHGPSSPLMAPMAVIKAHLPRCLPAASARYPFFGEFHQDTAQGTLIAD